MRHWREKPVPLVTTVSVMGLLPTAPVSTYTATANSFSSVENKKKQTGTLGLTVLAGVEAANGGDATAARHQ